MSNDNTDGKGLLLYVRQGCHLCEDMVRDLQSLFDRELLDFEIRDVDSHQNWIQSYGDKVPLLLGDGKVLSEYFLDQNKLQQYLNERSKSL